MRTFTTYIFLVFLFVSARAQDPQFVMSAPNAVENGQQFRLSFTINERGDKLQLPPGLSDNFQILMGPSTGQSTSIQTINGRTTTQVSYSYTYILRAKQEGIFELRPASIEVNGKIIESNSLQIQVVKANSQPNRQQQANQPQQGQPETLDLDKENLFVRVDLSKRSAYRGEQIISTVKLYVDPNIPIYSFDEVNLPTYEGFYTQDIEIPQQINFTREVYNDKIYQVGILKKSNPFPATERPTQNPALQHVVVGETTGKTTQFFRRLFRQLPHGESPRNQRSGNGKRKRPATGTQRFHGWCWQF